MDKLLKFTIYHAFDNLQNMSRDKTKGGEQKMNKFKGFVAARGIKQQELMRLLGLCRSTISQKLNGKQQFNINEIRIICETYKISADEYFM